MLTYLSIIITAISVNNIVFAQFLGICPFLGVSKKLGSAVGMGAAVTFVMAIATCVTWLLQSCVLNPLSLGYIQTIVFILVIAALVQMLEEDSPRLVSGSRCVPAADNHQLRRARCCHTGGAEGFQSGRVACLCRVDGCRLHARSRDLCRHTRATDACRCSSPDARCAHRSYMCGAARHGIYGICGNLHRLILYIWRLL